MFFKAFGPPKIPVTYASFWLKAVSVTNLLTHHNHPSGRKRYLPTVPKRNGSHRGAERPAQGGFRPGITTRTNPNCGPNIIVLIKLSRHSVLNTVLEVAG